MKIGVLGLGSIGRRHAVNLERLGHVAIGYDPVRDEPKRRDEVLMLADAIVIASPTSEHRKDLVDTKRAGTPTFVEKPIGEGDGTLNETWPQVAMVGYNLRFHAVVEKAKEWLPLIGTPLWANFCCAQYNEKPAYRRDGVILNWSHEIDLALYLLGPGICRSASSNPGESMADINIMHHAAGAMSTVHLDYITKPEQRYFTITGTDGVLTGDLAPCRYLYLQSNKESGLDKSFQAKDDYDENYVEEMQAFINRLEGKETIGATCQDGKDVLEICLDAKYGRWQI